jgi:hypothetical protein
MLQSRENGIPFVEQVPYWESTSAKQGCPVKAVNAAVQRLGGRKQAIAVKNQTMISYHHPGSGLGNCFCRPAADLPFGSPRRPVYGNSQ